MSDKSFDSTVWDEWSLVYDDYDAVKEKSRESLLAVGNGYLGVRGAMEECRASDNHYPGTYVAGVYNRLISKVADRDIENEDFVNCPNSISLNFRINSQDWLSIDETNIISIKRSLDFRTGVLSREMLIEDQAGNRSRVTSRRLASMLNQHIVAYEYCIEAMNYSGNISVRSQLDGTITNDGVTRYRSLNQQHLEAVEEGGAATRAWLRVSTSQSQIEIAEAVKHSVSVDGEVLDVNWQYMFEPGMVQAELTHKLEQNHKLCIQKFVTLYTSKPDDVSNPLHHCLSDLDDELSFRGLTRENKKKWKNIWNNIDIQIDGDPKSQSLIRLHLYHLIVTASPHNTGIDAGIPARGLHGEAYRGHIFWDELYILPLYNLFLPDVARSILNYRYKRLDKARAYAKEHGYEGAMFPWQSGSDGREETQVVHLNPVSGEWGDDYSSLQRHISIAVAYNTWYYYQVTDDLDFMIESGAEMYLDICRFWASKCILNKSTGRFEISKVMGPDEFHEEHAKSPGGGVKDNAYTNIMVAWLFLEAQRLWEQLPAASHDAIAEKAGLSEQEVKHWLELAHHLNLVVSPEGILSQFDGFFELKELDWEAYRTKYHDIYRLDRILKAEGKSPDDFKLAKQADTMMIFYNLDLAVVSGVLGTMNYPAGEDLLRKNYDYYIARTSHGSTLSRVVHAFLANEMGDRELGWKLYHEALESDYDDIQGGTTAEGIHAGVMGGTVLTVITSFAGVNLRGEYLAVHPKLPDHWKGLRFRFYFKGCEYKFSISHDTVDLEILSKKFEEVRLVLMDKKILLQTNKKHLLKYLPNTF